jgi:hypothetical protein
VQPKATLGRLKYNQQLLKQTLAEMEDAKIDAENHLCWFERVIQF